MARPGIHLAVALLLTQFPAHASDLCTPLPAASLTAVLGQFCRALGATNQGDAAALRTLMADDFALTTVSGKYFGMSKQEMIARWTEPAPAGTTSVSRLVRVFRSHQAATFGFVSGEIEDRTQSGSTVTCTRHAFTDIWELRDSRWQWVQSHESGYSEGNCVE